MCAPHSATLVVQCLDTMELKNNQPLPEEAAKMGVPHITSFCWCMGLEMGSKIIGFVHLAVSITLMILCSVFAESARGFVGTVEDAGDHLYSAWYKIAVSAAVVTTVHVLLAAMLIYSTFKRKTLGLRLWVYVMSLLYAAALIYLVVEMCLHGLSGTGSDIFLSFLEGLLFFAALAYSILCVNSYYLMLRSAEDMEGPGKTYY